LARALGGNEYSRWALEDKIQLTSELNYPGDRYLDRQASVNRRIVAAVVGAATLGIAGIITAGIALAAPVGMAAARVMMRRQHKPSTLRSSWLGAVSAVAIVFLLFFGGVLVRAPAGTFAKVQRSADSAAAMRSEHPPAWLQRVAPGNVPAAPQLGRQTTHALALLGGVAGGIIGCIVLGAVIGTIGWAASLPLAFAINGRWSQKPPQAAPAA
jgi:hypothetical protein